jgi:hypothetical protein
MQQFGREISQINKSFSIGLYQLLETCPRITTPIEWSLKNKFIATCTVGDSFLKTLLPQYSCSLLSLVDTGILQSIYAKE